MLTKILMAGIVAAVIIVYVATPAEAIFATPSNPFFSEGSVFSNVPQQGDGTQGYQYKNDIPPYGYWGVGPDYGNYKWPYKGPYAEKPRGRPMDALTYAPASIEASAASVKMTGNNTVDVSWPGGKLGGVRSVDFAVLGEAGEVLSAISDMEYPFRAKIPLPYLSQKVRVTVNYEDGFSSSVFWIP